MVPTAAGSWRRGCEVTARCTGVAPDDLLDAELAELLPVHDDLAAAEGRATDDDVSNIEQAEWTEEDCARSLEVLLTKLRAQVPEQALALFAALVADRDLFERLARDRLALPQARILALQNKLGEIVRSLTGDQAERADDFSSLRKNARLRFTLATGGPVQIVALDGSLRDASSAIQAPFQILGAGHQQPRRLRVADFTADAGTIVHEMKLSVSDGPISQRTLEELIEEAGPLVLWHFRFYKESIFEEFQKAFAVEQATVEDARARLEDRLPQILAELKPARGSRLRDALNRYETKEQSIPPDRRADQLPAAKRSLWDDVASAQTATDLLALIRRGIGNYGYGPARVVFELFQNADDATLQHPPEGATFVPCCVQDRDVCACNTGDVSSIILGGTRLRANVRAGSETSSTCFS